jgi:hypothetical protein
MNQRPTGEERRNEDLFAQMDENKVFDLMA